MTQPFRPSLTFSRARYGYSESAFGLVPILNEFVLFIFQRVESKFKIGITFFCILNTISYQYKADMMKKIVKSYLDGENYGSFMK